MSSRRVGALLIIAALAAVPAAAESPASEKRAPEAPKVAAAPPADANTGLTVFIDPDTKKIRPPEPGEIEQLLKGGAPRPQAAPRLLTNLPPGAGVGMRLDESYEMFMVVSKKPDGTFAASCVTGGAEAKAAVAAGAPAALPAPVRAKEAGDAR